jgi:glutathione synthase/RimK-type ligase-like ATP-grasp enzyme
MGAPGHEPGVHDLRIAICGGQITGCLIRMAKTGMLHSNVAQGGNKIYLSLDQVPTEIAVAVREIDRVFEPQPRFYSADFAYSNEGWKLIELNDYVVWCRCRWRGSY